jgi:hypothetical protein
MTYKNPHHMTIEELKQAANNDAVVYFKRQLDADPLNPQAKAEYEQACSRANTRPDAELNRLQSMTREQLAAEWEVQGKAVEAESLEQYRTMQAKQWLASQPRYTPTPESASKLIARLDAQGLRGSVYELDRAFNELVERGEIEAPPLPVKLYNSEELKSLSVPQLKEYFESR